MKNFPSFSKLPIRKWNVICYPGTSEVGKEKLTYAWNCQWAILNSVNCFNFKAHCKLVESIPHGNQKCLSCNFSTIRKEVLHSFNKNCGRVQVCSVLEELGLFLLYIEPHTWHFLLLQVKDCNSNLFSKKPFRQLPQRGHWQRTLRKYLRKQRSLSSEK